MILIHPYNKLIRVINIERNTITVCYELNELRDKAYFAYWS